MILQDHSQAYIWRNSSPEKYYAPRCLQQHYIYNSQDMGTIKMSINRGMNKEAVVHIYDVILLSHKKL